MLPKFIAQIDLVDSKQLSVAEQSVMLFSYPSREIRKTKTGCSSYTAVTVGVSPVTNSGRFGKLCFPITSPFGRPLSAFRLTDRISLDV